MFLTSQDLVPGNYLKDGSRLTKLEHQLSPPSKPKDSSTPQPDEPLQINMPTPTTTMMTQVISNPTAISNAASALSAAAPLQPQYGYNEINLNFSSVSNHIIINDQVLVSVFDSVNIRHLYRCIIMWLTVFMLLQFHGQMCVC